MYLRPVRKDELVEWLKVGGFVNNDLVEVHVEALATALIQKYDLIAEFKTPV